MSNNLPIPSIDWDEAAVRASYQQQVESCGQFFEHYPRPDDENEAGRKLFDLSLCAYEMYKHLVAVDCLSTRAALIAELERLLTAPAMPSSHAPCRLDKYLAYQQIDIVMEISNLSLEREPLEALFLRLVGRPIFNTSPTSVGGDEREDTAHERELLAKFHTHSQNNHVHGWVALNLLLAIGGTIALYFTRDPNLEQLFVGLFFAVIPFNQMLYAICLLKPKG